MEDITQRSVLGVITARGGSKGIPGKNSKLLAGKPLIAWTIDEAKKSKRLTHLIVSTDDENIADIAKAHGAEVPFMRPKELAEDTTPHLPVMQHAVREYEKLTGLHFDAVVILQPTSPFRRAEYIDDTLDVLFKEGTDSAVSLFEVDSKYHPIKIKRLVDGRVEAFSTPEIEGTRRQELEKAYRRSSDVYAITRECLLEKGRLYGDTVAGHIVPHEWVIDIDTLDDWEAAESIAMRWKELYT